MRHEGGGGSWNGLGALEEMQMILAAKLKNANHRPDLQEEALW